MLFLSLLLFSSGDLTITFNGKPIATGRALTGADLSKVNEAKSIAAGIDPDSISTLGDPSISVGVLPKSVADAAGVSAVTDADTILVTRDALNGDSTALAVILSHEADHAQNGPLGPCQHAGSFMDVAASWASAINGPNGHAGMCDKFKDAVDKADKFAAACAKSGGVPTRANGSPAPDWPMPNPPCQD